MKKQTRKRKHKTEDAEMLRGIRKNWGLTQGEFAQAMGCSKPGLQVWESAERQPPEHVRIAAQCFDVFALNPNQLLAQLLELRGSSACGDDCRKEALAISEAFLMLAKKGRRLLAEVESKKAPKKSPRKA